MAMTLTASVCVDSLGTSQSLNNLKRLDRQAEVAIWRMICLVLEGFHGRGLTMGQNPEGKAKPLYLWQHQPFQKRAQVSEQTSSLSVSYEYDSATFHLGCGKES